MSSTAIGQATVTYIASKECNFLLSMIRSVKKVIEQFTGMMAVPIVIEAETSAAETLTIDQEILIRYLYTSAYGVPYPKGTLTNEEQAMVQTILEVLGL